jgi:hypothetical protein
MKRPAKMPLFLQRENYRQRRVRSAAKLVPFLGALLWAIPLAWGYEGTADQVGSWGVIYVFGVWVVLIALTFVLTSKLSASDKETILSDSIK